MPNCPIARSNILSRCSNLRRRENEPACSSILNICRPILADWLFNTHVGHSAMGDQGPGSATGLFCQLDHRGPCVTGPSLDTGRVEPCYRGEPAAVVGARRPQCLATFYRYRNPRIIFAAEFSDGAVDLVEKWTGSLLERFFIHHERRVVWGRHSVRHQCREVV